ncbi:hypothetical protein MMYC01_210679 [Madurella mycetomatis]|uniref:DUF8035 domain-containing protein n=1 Tax=Madurella mycetomatis TaxID=100816 RepID=A0A175VMY5_9PEZI|nr:hypothetical protein MMYC01_210679 [Madurella mycetomatis]
MADPAQYRYSGAPRRRSPPLYNPARASMPVTAGGYDPLYPGDIHAMSASHHEDLVSRPADEYRTSAVPISATTYAVRKEPLSRSTSVTDGTRQHRVIEPTSKRPIIVTTKHAPSGPRSGSPSRDPYRSSDEYYTLPASSIPRGRPSGHGAFSPTMDEEEYRRLKERTTRGGDSYRSSRQGPLYPGTANRSNTLDFDDDGYEYTNPSDLVRYDLDHDRPRKRRESVDRYYRPTVSISTDLARPYEQRERRPRGPPPTTWGLDKINRPATGGIYDGAGLPMPLPPAVPLAPDARRSGLLEGPGSSTGDHRAASHPRPISLIQDDPVRSGHPGDYYRDDELSPRDYRGRDYDYFKDDSVVARGFGIRVNSMDTDEHRHPHERLYRDERREYWDDRREYADREPRTLSDEDLEGIIRHEYDDRDRRHRRDPDYAVDDDAAFERRDHKPPPDDGPESRKDKIRDKVTSGLGLVAATTGLKSAMKRADKDKEGSPPSAKREGEDDGRHRLDEADSRPRTSRKEHMLGDEDYEIVEHPSDRPRKGKGPDPSSSAEKNGDAAASPPRDHSSSGDEGRTRTRRRPRASSFNPNDTAGLAALKAQLAASEEKDKATKRDPSPERKPSPTRENDDANSSALVTKEDRQVRVVPPPSETAEKKPLKGILKQPKAQFPEEPNPVREGVAPHKDDKTKANVPPGARWTKISRKMVNPDALKIGKERFEVRDDFVIVLRVLSKEEIQAYADTTAKLRERRRKEYERDKHGGEKDDGDRDGVDDDEKKKRHRQHRRDDKERDKDRDRHRRHKHDSDIEDGHGGDAYESRPSRPAEYHSHGHHRPLRE